MTKTNKFISGKKSISLNTEIKLKLQHLITYSIFLVTIGASIYTLFKTLPEITQISDDLQHLEKREVQISTDIEWIKNFLEIKKTENK